MMTPPGRPDAAGPLREHDRLGAMRLAPDSGNTDRETVRAYSTWSTDPGVVGPCERSGTGSLAGTDGDLSCGRVGGGGPCGRRHCLLSGLDPFDLRKARKTVFQFARSCCRVNAERVSRSNVEERGAGS
jgi:hypothetical protein